MTTDRSAAADVHYCEVLEEDTRGWWHGRCACNAKFGPAPDADIVVDDLMQHAYEQGILDERRGRVPR